jgi:hypothetical protein
VCRSRLEANVHLQDEIIHFLDKDSEAFGIIRANEGISNPGCIAGWECLEIAVGIDLKCAAHSQRQSGLSEVAYRAREPVEIRWAEGVPFSQSKTPGPSK